MSDVSVYRGTVVHSTETDDLVILPDKAIGVNRDGKIIFIENGLILPEVQKERRIPDENIKHLEDGWFMVPGFIDCCANAALYSTVGTGTDVSTLDHMTQYISPAMQRMHEEQYAATLCQHVVKRTLQCGTTTAVYNPTAISSAARILCNAIISEGQRGYVGLEIYLGIHDIDLHESQINLAEDFIHMVQKRNNKQLLPYINQSWLLPTMLLTRLKKLQDDENLLIKTRLSQIPRSAELFEHRNWIAIERSGTHHLWNGEVLNSQTLLTHCVHCSEDDVNLIQKRDSAVIHCPNSNITRGHGACDVRILLQKGIRVGLGTDFGYGSSASILDAIRQTVFVSKLLKTQKPAHYRHITIPEAFKMATLGSAKALGIDKSVGSFEVGKQFDALFVDPDTQQGPFDIFLEADNAKDIVMKFLNLGDDRNIKEVYVSGRKSL